MKIKNEKYQMKASDLNVVFDKITRNWNTELFKSLNNYLRLYKRLELDTIERVVSDWTNVPKKYFRIFIASSDDHFIVSISENVEVIDDTNKYRCYYDVKENVDDINKKLLANLKPVRQLTF